MPGSSCNCLTSFLALHCTRSVINLFSFLILLESDFRLLLRFHIIVPFPISWGHSKIARTAFVAFLRDTSFSLLLRGNRDIMSSKVSLLNLLPRNECCCCMKLVWVFYVILINLFLDGRPPTTLSLKSLPVRCNIIFCT